MGGRDGDGGGRGLDMVCEGADAVGEVLMDRGRMRGVGELAGGVTD